jgi:hypothetical protein
VTQPVTRKLTHKPKRQRRIKEDIKNIKHIQERAKRAPASAGRFEEFWSEYPRREGSNPRKTALQVYQQAVKSGADEQSIIDGAKRYRSDLRRRGQEGSRYVAQAVTWLRQSRWEDDLPPAGSSGNNPPPITPGSPQGAAEPVDWRKWMDGYIRLPPHSRVWYGPAGEPGYPGCESACEHPARVWVHADPMGPSIGRQAIWSGGRRAIARGERLMGKHKPAVERRRRRRAAKRRAYRARKLTSISNRSRNEIAPSTEGER